VSTDVQIYCDCMARIRHRINVVQTIMSGGIKIGHADQTAELIFIQFRKTLEEIAFASFRLTKRSTPKSMPTSQSIGVPWIC